jgi:hypothetical protein
VPLLLIEPLFVRSAIEAVGFPDGQIGEVVTTNFRQLAQVTDEHLGVGNNPVNIRAALDGIQNTLNDHQLVFDGIQNTLGQLSNTLRRMDARLNNERITRDNRYLHRNQLPLQLLQIERSANVALIGTVPVNLTPPGTDCALTVTQLNDYHAAYNEPSLGQQAGNAPTRRANLLRMLTNAPA